MNKTLFKLLIYLLLVSPPLLLPMATMWYHGDMMPLKSVHKKQQEDKTILYNPTFHDSSMPYKYSGIRYQNKSKIKTLALGNSRILGWKKSHFKDNLNFYNAGRAISNIYHFRPFLELIYPHTELDTIFICLDVYFFNPSYIRKHGKYQHADLWINEPSFFYIFKSGWKRFYKDYLNQNWSFEGISNKTHLGIYAKQLDRGFRYDGSYDRENINRVSKFQEHLERINQQGHRYEYGSHMDQAALKEFSMLLKECKDKKIKVIAFLPPYPPTVYQKIKENKNNYQIFFNAIDTLTPIFIKNQHSLIDLFDPQISNLNDLDFEDALHPIAKGDIKILKTLSHKLPDFEQFLSEKVLTD